MCPEPGVNFPHDPQLSFPSILSPKGVFPTSWQQNTFGRYTVPPGTCSSFHRHPFLSEPHPESTESQQTSWWAHCGRTSGAVTAGNQPCVPTASWGHRLPTNMGRLRGTVCTFLVRLPLLLHGIPRLCLWGKACWLQGHNKIRILTRLQKYPNLEEN